MENFNYEIGKVTKFIYDNDAYLGRITKFNGKECHTKVYLCITRKGYFYECDGIFYLHVSIETPTPEEIKWFEACEKENKFIPLAEINTEPQYETY